MLEKITLGPSFNKCSAAYNPEQAAFVIAERQKVLEDLLAAHRDTPTLPTTSRNEALKSLIREAGKAIDKTHGAGGRPVSADDGSLSAAKAIAGQIFDTKNPYYFGQIDAPINAPVSLEINIEKGLPALPLLLRPDNERQEKRLEKVNGPFTLDGNCLCLTLTSPEPSLNRAVMVDIRDKKPFSKFLTKYWAAVTAFGDMCGSATPDAITPLDTARKDLHDNVYYSGLRTGLEEIGIAIGSKFERDLFLAIAHAYPDRENPFPRMAAEQWNRLNPNHARCFVR